MHRIFPRSGRGFLSAGQCQSQKEALQSARRINRRTTCKASFLNLKNTLQSGCLTLDPFPPISLRYKRHPLPSPFMLQQFSDAVFTPKRPLFGGGTMTQAGSGQYEKVIACYRNNRIQNFFALPLVHHPGPLRALRVGLRGSPGPWGNPESQTGGAFLVLIQNMGLSDNSHNA